METVIFVDKTTLQPACVLLQAAIGGDSEFLKRHFDAEYWTLELGNLIPVKVTSESAVVLLEYLNGTQDEWCRRR